MQMVSDITSTKVYEVLQDAEGLVISDGSSLCTQRLMTCMGMVVWRSPAVGLAHLSPPGTDQSEVTTNLMRIQKLIDKVIKRGSSSSVEILITGSNFEYDQNGQQNVVSAINAAEQANPNLTFAVIDETFKGWVPQNLNPQRDQIRKHLTTGWIEVTGQGLYRIDQRRDPSDYPKFSDSVPPLTPITTNHLCTCTIV